jgi:transcriptional regulator with XRE-family HTH domain
MKLAEIVDMNFNYIGQIERGEANVTIKTMITLADALGVELSELFNFSF